MTAGESFILYGFLIVNFGFLFSYFMSLVIYGYGILVANSENKKSKINDERFDKNKNIKVEVKEILMKEKGGIY